MSRKFTTREKVLLLILAVLLICCGYYYLVFQPVSQTISDAGLRQADAETSIMLEEIRASKLARMKEELAEEAKRGHSSEIPDYDNVERVVRLLNQALSAADSYNLAFTPVSVEEHIATRTIAMNFTCGSYAQAKEIIGELYRSPYRSQINALSLNAQPRERGQAGSVETDPVAVQMTVTFYEYVT